MLPAILQGAGVAMGSFTLQPSPARICIPRGTAPPSECADTSECCNDAAECAVVMSGGVPVCRP